MNSNVVLAVISEGCSNCKEFLEFWEKQKFNFQSLELRKINFVSYEGQGLAGRYDFIRVPAIILNDSLISSGPIDRVALLKDLKQLTK